MKRAETYTLRDRRVVDVLSLVRQDRREVGDRPCYLCGAATNGALGIHVVDGGAGACLEIDSEYFEAEAPEADLGLQAIGPECAKKLPPGFVRVLS